MVALLTYSGCLCNNVSAGNVQEMIFGYDLARAEVSCLLADSDPSHRCQSA